MHVTKNYTLGSRFACFSTCNRRSQVVQVFAIFLEFFFFRSKTSLIVTDHLQKQVASALHSLWFLLCLISRSLLTQRSFPLSKPSLKRLLTKLPIRSSFGCILAVGPLSHRTMLWSLVDGTLSCNLGHSPLLALSSQTTTKNPLVSSSMSPFNARSYGEHLGEFGGCRTSSCETLLYMQTIVGSPVQGESSGSGVAVVRAGKIN